MIDLKRLLSAVLAAALLVSAVPSAGAASDIDNHWAKQYITALNSDGVINPSSSGAYTPNQAVSRWEFMRYINRAFGFTDKATISYTDVAVGSTYYDTVQTAVKYGYINGVGNDKMDPEGTLTREQAATILGRLHKYTPDTADTVLSFSDKSQISDWSLDYVAEAVKQGYINGYTDGTFAPAKNITRAEIAKVLYFFMGTSLRTANKAYTAGDLLKDAKNVSISAACSLSDVTVPGNLYITEGVASGAVKLNNVTVEGDIIVSGGDITMDGVGAESMIVKNPLGVTPQVTCTGNTNIGKAEIQTAATLRESALGVSAGGFSDLQFNGENLTATLDAVVWDITVDKPASIITTGSTEINELTSNAKTTLTGGCTIQKATINASGCELLMQPTQVELASGITATIAGESVSSSNGVTVTPASLTIDTSNTSSLSHSYDFSFNSDKDDLSRVVCNGETLKSGTDYNLLSDKNGIRVYKTYLTTLKSGTYTMQIYFDDGTKGSAVISTSNSSQSAVSPSSLTFDKYEGSANYSDQTVTLSLPTGTTLDSVKLASTVLERSTDYTYTASSGTVTLLRDTLANKSAGSYVLTFVPNRGASITCALTISDSAPVNEILPTTADFDANISSGGYADIVVTLNPVNDAKLRSIKCDNKTLEENWHYKLDGNTVTLSKSAIATFAKGVAAYADFTFYMSGGESPVLRVNYVTTYGLTAQVVDDIGGGVSGVSVSFAPSDSATGTAAQTATTDTDGRATVYVKRGTYTVTATDSRFTAPVSQSIQVSSTRTVKLTGEILETVEITVTNSYGAKLSGAVVSIGGKSVTTGADGLATFSLRRSSYTAQVACSGYTTQSMPIVVDETIRERVVLK